MIDALRVLWQALQDLRLRGYGYIWSNLLFVGLCLPIVTAPSAFSALMYIGHSRYDGTYESELEVFWGAFRRNFWRALVWGMAHLAFAIVHFTNVIFYPGPEGIVTQFLRASWFLIGIIWFGTFFLTWPIYYEMEQTSLIKATQNAVLMVLKNPVFILTIVIAMLLISAISIVFIVSWVLVTWGFFSSLSNAVVKNRLQHL